MVSERQPHTPPGQQPENTDARWASFLYLVDLVRTSVQELPPEEAISSIRRGMRVLEIMGVLPDR